MRLFVLLVAATLLKQCTGESVKKITGTIKVEYGLYCPDKTNWEFKLSFGTVANSPPAISGKATNHFEFRSMDNVHTSEYSSVTYWVSHTCTTGGKWSTLFPYEFGFEENKITYEFIGIDFNNLKIDPPVVYDKLFIRYLKKECLTGDCSAIRDRVVISCSRYQNSKDECIRFFEKTLKDFLQSRPTSTQTPVSTDTTGKSNTTTFIVIGSVVGVVLLIALVVTYFLCKKKKKANNQNGSGMSGTGTNSKTMTKSGTTKQGTTTGAFQKTGTVGTGNTGNTTTGGQRY